jgi:hypothetical protein
MRRFLAFALAFSALLLLAPGVVDAKTCGCRAWSRQFSRHYHTGASRSFNHLWAAHSPEPPYSPAVMRQWAAWRNAVKRQIRTFGRRGRFDPAGWCAEHPKECKAVAECLYWGGVTWEEGIRNNASIRFALQVSLSACAAAAFHARVTGG